MLACATALSLTAFAEQPDKWVRYVEAKGLQYVDTGIIGRPNTKIETKVEWLSFYDSAFLASGDWENNTRFYMCYCLNDKAEMVLSQRENTVVTLKSSSWNTRFEKNRVYTYTAEFSATNSAHIRLAAAFY